jgi:hypothetical protein
MPLSTIFQLYRGGFIGGGNWSTRRKPTTCCKSLTNFISLKPTQIKKNQFFGISTNNLLKAM